jgi:hypothetical protein
MLDCNIDAPNAFDYRLQPIDSGSNHEKPMFYPILAIELSKEIRFQSRYGDDSDFDRI